MDRGSKSGDEGHRASWGARGLSLIERFIPRATIDQGGDVLRRLQIVVALVLIATAITPAWLVTAAVDGDMFRLSVGLVNMTGYPLLLLLVRAGSSPERVGNLLAAIVVGPATITLLASSSLGPNLLAFVVVPMVVLLVAGGRLGWVWCGTNILIFGVLSLGVEDMDERKWLFALALTTICLTGIGFTFERVRQRAFEQLVLARDAARDADAAKSRFLANMSHEIRTPMNGVLGMLSILLDTQLDDSQRDYAKTARDSGVALLDLLNDILDFSRIEANQLVLEEVPFDLRALVEDLLDQVAAQADQEGLELILRYVPHTPVRVVGDHGRVRQIMLNLVSNAIKFTEEGHVLVTVEIDPDERKDPPIFRCSVQDTGIGIPQAKQVQIFEEFQQVDGTTTRSRAGTGLGLAIARNLAMLMNGELGVESQVGQGSTFWLELPLAVDPDEPADPSPRAELRGKEVLVVDGNPVCRTVLEERLVSWGFAVGHSASGSHALDELHEAAVAGRPYQLALLDSHMPPMSGLELARAIKGDPMLRDTILVMLSRPTRRMSAEQLQRVGCAGQVAKPLHHRELLEVMVSAWQQRQTSHRAPSRGRPWPEEPPRCPRTRPGTRVLVVEDNAINQKVAQRLLTNMGCRVDVAGNGREALQLLELRPYDLVLMDVQMPEMDGLAATAQFRALESRRARLSDARARVPIVAMTAHAMQGDRERCLAAGMDGYLSKPVQRGELLRVLDEYGRRPAARSDSGPHGRLAPETAETAEAP